MPVILQSLAQSAPELLAASRHVCQKLFVGDLVENRVGRVAHQRSARERGAVVAGRHGVRHLLGAEDGADGKAAREGFRDCHDIRRDVNRLVAPEVAGATEAALDLVEDQDRASLLADILEPLEERLVRGEDPPLALHGLDEHGGGFTLDDCLFGALQVSVRRERVTRGEGLERRPVLLLPGQVEGAEGAAVEAVGEGDRLRGPLRGVRIGGFRSLHLHLPGELDGTLVRFGAAVAVEDAVGEARVDELAREGGAGFGVVQVADVAELVGLLGHRRDPVRVAVPEAVHRDARAEVEVLFALGVPHLAPEAVREHRRVESAAVGVDHALVLVLAHSVRVHGRGRGRDGGPDLEGAALTRDRGAGAAERRYRRAKGDGGGGGGVHHRRYAVGAMRE